MGLGIKRITEIELGFEDDILFPIFFLKYVG